MECVRANETRDYGWQECTYNTNTPTHSWQVTFEESANATCMVVSPGDLMNLLNAIGPNGFVNPSAIISLVLRYSKLISPCLIKSRM